LPPPFFQTFNGREKKKKKKTLREGNVTFALGNPKPNGPTQSVTI